MISPLLANIYLHYALDLWAARWRRRKATGDMIIVRYADDFIVGIPARESTPGASWTRCASGYGKFALSLHPEKTRLIEFGRFAAERRKRLRARQAGDLQLHGLHLHLRQDPCR